MCHSKVRRPKLKYLIISSVTGFLKSCFWLYGNITFINYCIPLCRKLVLFKVKCIYTYIFNSLNLEIQWIAFPPHPVHTALVGGVGRETDSSMNFLQTANVHIVFLSALLLVDCGEAGSPRSIFCLHTVKGRLKDIVCTDFKFPLQMTP